MPEISKTADQALSLLLAVAQRGPLSTAELSRQLGMNRTVAQRLLATLHQRGFVHRMSSGFVLGATLLEIADQVSFATREAALPAMHALSAESGETVVLHALDGDTAVVLAQVSGREQILRVERVVGTHDPLVAGASGLALLAFQPQVTVRRALARAKDPKAVERKLTEVRRRGYSLTRNELRGGIHAIAAPITDGNGHAVASMTVLMPANRGEGLADHREALLKAAGDVVVTRSSPRPDA
jgi:DNA-binding IclR family transcriptional regulator